MKVIIAHVRRRINNVNNRLHHAHGPVHFVYFVAVAVEAGKWYGAVAGGLALLTLIGMLSGDTDGEG